MIWEDTYESVRGSTISRLIRSAGFDDFEVNWNSPLTRLSVNSPLLPPDFPADAVGVLTWFFPLPMMELVVQGYVEVGGWMGIESSPIDQNRSKGCDRL